MEHLLHLLANGFGNTWIDFQAQGQQLVPDVVAGEIGVLVAWVNDKRDFFSGAILIELALFGKQKWPDHILVGKGDNLP